MESVERIAAFMRRNGLTLATAESCTAGLIASTLADVPGAGALLDCAFVVYTPEAKRRCLGLSPAILENHNLTSETVACEMARGAAERCVATVVIANTGVADSSGDGMPAGTQCYAWLFRRSPNDPEPRIFTETQRFRGDRSTVRTAAAHYALARVIDHHCNLLRKRNVDC
jgi:PncC family amidohydrolase